MASYKKPYGHRKDNNQKQIEDRLRKAPILSVFDVSQHAGLGFDLLVTVAGLNLFYEIKSPGKRDQLTDAEEAFLHKTKGHLLVVESFWEIVDDIDAEVTDDRLRHFFEQLEDADS